MKKRLITLLLAVILVVSLLPMSAFAWNTNDGTQYLVYGANRLQKTSSNGVYTLNLIDDGHDPYWPANQKGPQNYVIWAEPGTKIMVTAGSGTWGIGSGAAFTDNSTSSVKLTDSEKYTAGLGGTNYRDDYDILGLSQSEAKDAVYNKDWSRAWRGGLFQKNARLIDIKPTATTNDPNGYHVIKIHGEWGAGGEGWLLVVIADRQTVIDKARADSNYKVQVTVLDNSQHIPSEPAYTTDRNWYKFGSDNKVKLKSNGGGPAEVDYADSGSTIVSSTRTEENPSGLPIIKENFTKLSGYRASVDGTNTGGIADATGELTKAAINLTPSDFEAMLNDLYTRKRDNNSFYAADGKKFSEITDISKYEMFPYVVKLQTSNNIGWKIDCAIAPKDRVQYSYDLNLPAGLSVDGISAPAGDLSALNTTFKATVDAPYIGTTAMTQDQIVNAVDMNGNTIKLEYKGWTLDGTSGELYQKGRSVDFTSSTNARHVFYGKWEVMSESVEITKIVENPGNATLNKEQQFEFTMNFSKNGEPYNGTYTGYVIDTDGLPVGFNEETGAFSTTNLGNGSKMTIKDGQTIHIDAVDVGVTVTATEGSLPDGFAAVPKDAKAEIYVDGALENGEYSKNFEFKNIYGKYTIVHSSDGSSEKLNLADTDITDNVKDGYLYAGYYSDSGYKLDQAITDKPGNDFTPTVGATYYLKEISTDYACPSLVATYYKNYTNKPVSGLYLITAMDNKQYKDCGFVIADGNQGLAENSFAQTLNVSASGGTYKTYNANTFFSALSDKDVLGVASIDKTTTGVDVSVYYVTLDGVRVNGVVTKTINNSGYVGGDSPISFVEKTASKAANAPQTDVSGAAAKSMMPTRADLGVNRTMSRVSTFSRINCAAPESVETENTVTCMALLDTISLKEGATTPGNVVESAQEIETPETPDVPESSGVTITVNVNGNVTEIKGDAGDYTGKIETPKQENKLFAGWYTDEACTVPADLTNVENDVTLYAKFIKASDVKISTVKTKLLSNSFKTTVSAKGEFESASFVCKMGSKTINVNGTKTASGFVGEWSTNTKLISKVVITPTFVTADGTTVYGEAQTFTYILGLFI